MTDSTITIVGTGSTGNLSKVNDDIIVDLGVTKTKLLNFDKGKMLKKASAVFITHEHADHANPALIKFLADLRPDLISRQVYMTQGTIDKLIQINTIKDVITKIPKQNIINEHSEFDFKTRSGKYHVRCYKAPHGGVECVGFIFTTPIGETIFWGTDLETTDFANVDDEKYDVICLEGNWDEQKLVDALQDEDLATHADSSMRHQSVQAFEKFCKNHSKPDTIKIQLHMSESFGIYSKINNYYLEPKYDNYVVK